MLFESKSQARESRHFPMSLRQWTAFCLFLFAPSWIAQAADHNEIPDFRVAVAIEGEIWEAKGVNAHQIDVTVNEGIATLEGTVDNLLSAERAKEIAERTKGVRAIVNQMKVRASEKPDDRIRVDVLSALATDPATDSWKFQVAVEDGEVTLEGELESRAATRLAETVVKAVGGVTGVRNRLTYEYATTRTDYEIEQDIVQRFRWDARFDGEVITVAVEDGEVTLSGSVGSVFEKSLARTFAYVNGVEAVDAEDLKVTWWSRDNMNRDTLWANATDDEIEKAVKDALLYDPRVYSFDPVVLVENGTVTLMGSVDNLEARRAAENDARNTVGVYRVKNYLKVRPNVPRTSTEIASDVRSALLRDPIVDRYEITVSAFGGDVYLSGDVDSYFEKSQAENVASKVNGVVEVHNNIDLVSTPSSLSYSTVRTQPDSDIREDIESKLWWSPFVDADEITVTVDDGVATLTGTVDNWNERREAGEDAIEGGAYKVRNKLEIDS